MDKASMKLLFLLIFCTTSSATPNGSVPLNSGTFDKLVLRFPYTLVRFGKLITQGPEQEAFKQLASSYGAHEKLLIAEVPIAEFGKKDNFDLKERFSIQKEDYPVYKLFSKKVGLKKPVEYKGDKTSADEIVRFLIRETGLYFGLPSCLKILDAFASRVIKYQDKENLIKQVQVIIGDMVEGDEKRRAEIYLKIFKKIQEKGNEFVESEIKRIEKLLQGKLSEKKRNDLSERSMILTCILLEKHKK